MNNSSFTIKAREAIARAQQISAGQNHGQVEPAHILTALLDEDHSVAAHLLKRAGINPTQITGKLTDILKKYPRVSGGDVPLSRDSSIMLQNAVGLMNGMGDSYLAIEHILLALTTSKEETGQMLVGLGATRDIIAKAIAETRKGSKIDNPSADVSYEALERFAKNLNALASQGKLDPVIGRDDEIRRVLQILTRRTKNNPILIGEPGVGKTAIAEGIAYRIINGDVPENLKSKTIYALDMGALLAGAKYKGEFEERLKTVMKEVIASDGEIILFIDEIHTLTGAGGGEGAMDAANIMKPALSRGELRAIGATTLQEYQKYFEKDKALERRFQTVMIEEPDTQSAISILRGLKERYENHHKIRIRDEAIITAVELSQRYITSRFLPDKAIDLVDEAAARLRLEINSLPEELENATRRIRQLEIEREAIKREGDKEKIKILNSEIANLTEEQNLLKTRWQNEKNLIEKIQQLKTQVEDFRIEAEKAEREGDYGRVAELRYGLMREHMSRIEALRSELMTIQGNQPMIIEEISSEDIARVVSKWTGIPVSRMLEGEREKLLKLEQHIHQRVIGQEEATAALADAIRRSRAGLQDSNRPIGSFIFLGTTGVGKTELARALAEYLFNDENNMVRIDMSEYQERHAVSRLIGAPPGYVGYDESGQLTEAIRRKPYSVVLLDEIEKAHPDVFNILLQVLDDGRLTDNKGRTANFRNTIIIMTSNIGSHHIQQKIAGDGSNPDGKAWDETRTEVFDMLKKTIRPEFLNRIDEIIMFRPLDRRQVKAITELQFRHLSNRLQKKDIHLEFTEKAVDFIASAGFDAQYGARPIKRAMQKEVMNPLARILLSSEINISLPIQADANEQGITFSNLSAAESG